MKRDHVFRRPDGTPYDPNPFNVRQYEKQYGPGGVPEGYSMDAITPVQSPRLITGIGIFLTAMAGMMIYGAFAAVGEPGLSIYAAIMAALTLAGAVWAFIMASRRQRWLQEQKQASLDSRSP
ncbi:hypothetical protein F8G81_17440 [Arthrobacter sp. CDRTa11]|uniref:hypothetical protein n=1 Tax=Arthrobacter sp. CDRTa11 TaxID=2651199 RepID=UPI002265F1BA|nr:hypothetical protein [Arthrobacter sp. CDRTa11]UZX04192.1 hypothetical protein F8G81_17440 [Arthrobacter sp. CDRTa11]